MIETERKFVMDEAADGPPIDHLARPLEIGSVHTVDLDALYYDTPYFRLVRSGAELRLRLGGPDAGWHLKLPGSRPDSRVELHRPGPEAAPGMVPAVPPPAVPGELADLVTARALPTGPPADRPAPHPPTDHRPGRCRVRPVAEVDEDEVRAFFDHHQEPEESWREVEIELGSRATAGTSNA